MNTSEISGVSFFLQSTGFRGIALKFIYLCISGLLTKKTVSQPYNFYSQWNLKL